MELQDAKQTIKNAIDIAVQKGCYSLDDTATIIKALEKLLNLDDVQFGEIHKVEK